MARNAANPKGKDLKTNNQIAYSEEVEQLNVDRARSLDELAVSDELFSGVLEAVRTDIRKGLKTEDLLAKYAQLAAARVVTIAATDQDSGRALSASIDILNRTLGKAVERKQIHHKLDKVDDKQLDAILLTEIEALDVDGQEADDE
jgi:hypothetical protein